MSDAFRTRLARLRRDPPSTPAPAASPAASPTAPPTSPPTGPPESAGLPASLRARLAASPGGDPDDAAPSTEAPTGLRAPTIGEPQRLDVVDRREGAFCARTNRVDLGGPPHGAWSLAEVDAADRAAIARMAKDPALGGLDLRQAVYLDTETSGLSGGAGVYVYMVGLGWYEGDAFVTWQSFLRHPGEEPAMLADVADRIRGASGVVSFFGKSFDRHRLEDKMRIHGVDPPFEGAPHLDLYHPFRRLTHGSLPDGRLQTMERALLAFEREDDLPGSLAPAAWFDYLAGRPHRLEGVFEHNHHDVLSLAALAAYLGRVETEERASGEPLVGPDARRAVALAETADDAGTELRWLECALARDVQGTDRRRVCARRADLLRRAGRVDDARVAYREALEECADDRFAVELFRGASMLMERPVGDLEHACAFARRAVDVARRTGATARQLESLRARVERLDARAAR
ncbi:MAG: ribonuclease H-like domain-containing protein [Planctomycetota bacterium]